MPDPIPALARPLGPGEGSEGQSPAAREAANRAGGRTPTTCSECDSMFRTAHPGSMATARMTHRESTASEAPQPLGKHPERCPGASQRYLGEARHGTTSGDEIPVNYLRPLFRTPAEERVDSLRRHPRPQRGIRMSPSPPAIVPPIANSLPREKAKFCRTEIREGHHHGLG